MSIGARLQELRKRENMTQEDLAERLDVTRQVISKWERDQSIPNTETVVMLSQIFQVSTDYLLGIENKTVAEKNLPQMKDYFEEKESDGMMNSDSAVGDFKSPITVNTQGKFSKWIALAFSIVATILAIKYLRVMCQGDDCSVISIAPGILVVVLTVLALILRIVMASRRQWSKKIREYIISYLTFLLAISAGIWSVFLIWFPAMEVCGDVVWATWITMLVLMIVAVVTAIVFGVSIAIRVVIKYRRVKK